MATDSMVACAMCVLWAGLTIVDGWLLRCAARGRIDAGDDQDRCLDELAWVSHPPAIGRCPRRSEALACRLDTEGWKSSRAPGFILGTMGDDRS